MIWRSKLQLKRPSRRGQGSLSCLLPPVSCPIRQSCPACLPSTLVETPLQISLFFAKQTQFQNGQYKHKYNKNKGLCQRTTNNDHQTLRKTNPIKPNPPAPLLRRERTQNLGAKRMSRFVGPASKIENPVSRIKHLPHVAVHSWLHCAKQSQSQNGQNDRKFSKNKGLCQRTTKNQQRTSSKTNPIKRNLTIPSTLDAVRSTLY